jgi:hypothetical protein
MHNKNRLEISQPTTLKGSLDHFQIIFGFNMQGAHFSYGQRKQKIERITQGKERH